MMCHRSRVLLTIAVLVALSVRGAAQHPVAPTALFTPLIDDTAPTVLDGARNASAVTERYAVRMRLENLFGAPSGAVSRVLLNIADHRWVAAFEHIESNAAGFRSWTGSIEGIEYSHVVFTERDGIVSGTVNAVSATYQLRTIDAGSYVLERIDTSMAPSDRRYDATAPSASTAVAEAADIVAGDNGTTLDVLMLYTPAARVAAGGVSQILAIASQNIADTNTIFGRSGISTRMRLVGLSELAYTEATDLDLDLQLLSTGTARTQRDTARADLVQLLVDSPDTTACGVAYQLTPSGFTADSFDAYSVVKLTPECRADYAATHQFGHNLGADHAREDGATTGVFNYSSGYKDPVNGFRTVMANPCAGVSCPVIPNFSNPLVFHNGAATGATLADNAKTITNTALIASNWRQAADGAVLPLAPVNLRTRVSGRDVTLEWDASTDATSYVLQVGPATGVYTAFNGSVGNVTSTTLSFGLGNYFWRVVASNANGSVASAETQFVVTSTCGIPSAPLNLVSRVSGSEVVLTWQAPTLGRVSTYVVHVGSAPGLTDRYNVRTGSSQVQASGRIPGGTYYVRVLAENECGLSAPSNEELVIVGGVPETPRDLTVRLDGGVAHLAWNISASSQPVLGYILEAGSAPGLSNLAVFDTGSANTSLTTVRPGPGIYYVRVRARGFFGVSAPTADTIVVVP